MRGRYHVLVLTSEYGTPTSATGSSVFYAGLNGLEVNYFDKENDKQTSPYTPNRLYCTGA